MKNINDYKGTKTVIHCKTQEEWDWVTKVLNKQWVNKNAWRNYESESCINCNGNEYCDLKYYTKYDYTIFPASDFITTHRTIEQIETELEVLRNELELLKAEAQTPEKKPIEFVKYLSHTKMELQKPDWCPKDFVSFKRIEINDTFNYDIIEATDSYGLKLVYLGHWNDGIK